MISGARHWEQRLRTLRVQLVRDRPSDVLRSSPVHLSYIGM
jgi:hypothetical protein